MIVHLHSDSFFINPFIGFITDNYGTEDHRIVVYRKGDYKREEADSSIVYYYKGKKDIGTLYKMLKKADKIVIHSLGIEMEMLLLLYMHKNLCRKTVWIIWGSDLYWKRDRSRDMMSNIIEHMRKKIISLFPYIGCLVTGDYELAVKWYRTDAAMYRVNYPDKDERKIVDALAPYDKGNDGAVNIVIGNSGTPSNGHKEVCEQLKRWKDENIKIYLPLSYGVPEYIEEVKTLYKDEFGDKAVIVDKLMPLEEYLKFLSTMDIGIFNNNRQQALGNIFALMYMGKGVYLKEGTSMWNELVGIQGSILTSCDEIAGENFLTGQLDESGKKINKDVAVKLHYSEEYLKNEWDKVFA